MSSTTINASHLTLSRGAHEELMLEVLCALDAAGGCVKGGGIDGKWRPATVHLFRLLDPEDGEWRTHEHPRYRSIVLAVHELWANGDLRCDREASGREEFFKIELAL